MFSNSDAVSIITESIEVKKRLSADSEIISRVISIACLMINSLSAGGRIFFAGNGGSAADAQHLAAELVSRFEYDRPGLPALSLSTDTSMITAISNDYGYERLFSRQLEAQARAGDVFVGITTSGKSLNIIDAFRVCEKLGVTPICLCGQSGDLPDVVRHVIRVPSANTARIQECHILIGHVICGAIEREMFPKQTNQMELS